MASTQRNPTRCGLSVSVVIPIYNAEADLMALLNCLAAQTYPSDRVEYLLVDNASTDRTGVLLQDAVGQFAQIHLRLLSQSQIQSAYAARNFGIQAARGEILAFTDADCRPQPNWLSSLVTPFADDSIGLVAGEITSLPGSARKRGNSPLVKGMNGDRFHPSISPIILIVSTLTVQILCNRLSACSL